MSTNYYNKIKRELLDYEITKKVKEYSINKSELQAKYNVGKTLIEAQGGEKRAKYGNSLIKEYSEKLSKETGLKYSPTSLKYMRQFYLFQKSHALRDQFDLSWNHYKKLFTLKDVGQIKYYIELCTRQHLSYRQLGERIKQKEYERLPEVTKKKLLQEKPIYEMTDFVKDPIIIKNTIDSKDISEKVLQKMILENIDLFLEQLGSGFMYVGHEYKLKLNNNYNYIDILLFNVDYNAYTVVELKTTKLKKEHIGQISFYMNYIDSTLKKDSHNKTMGIIITKEKDRYVLNYCDNKRVYNTTYLLKPL